MAAAIFFCALVAAPSSAPAAYAEAPLSPLKQLEAGVAPSDVQCRGERVLALRDSGSYACVYADTAGKKGWQTVHAVKPDEPALAPETVSELRTEEIRPSVLQYNLPLDTAQIQNWREFTQEIPLSPADVQLLQRNGFVVIQDSWYSSEYMPAVYERLEEKVPVYVTPDSVLHLYHVQFSESLKRIEVQYFFDDLWQLSGSLLDASLEQHDALEDPLLKEAALRNAAYFAVGLKLLEPASEQVCKKNPENCADLFLHQEARIYSFEPPDIREISRMADQEAALIGKAAGIQKSPLFEYNLDYSQFIPRGHYTNSEKLKNYFQAMMWYGNPTFLINHEDRQTARAMIIQSVLISDALLGSPQLKQSWDRIYAVTSFYVGQADDLGPYEYHSAYGAVSAGNSAETAPQGLHILSQPGVIDSLKIELARLPAPKIQGGGGPCIIQGSWTVEKAEACLEASKGFRLMGQRFIPDSYVFSNLVGMKYTGDGWPFTVIPTDFGPLRGFPVALDVMHAMLGSERALQILQEQGDSHYEDYADMTSSLKAEFASLDAEHWSQNIYWGWLHSLQALLGQYPEGYPTFMQTVAWQDQNLHTAAASWSQLRHDTILYAKQSVGGYFASMPPPPPPVTGYVEPVPEFYSRMHKLTAQTRDGLAGFGLLDDRSGGNLDSLVSVFERLYHISVKELDGQYLSAADYDFIDNFSDSMLRSLGGLDLENTRTTLVADVHTEPNTRQVLEVATGYVDLMVVAYALPEGQIVLGAGPVFSYYEFKHPLNDRLTDEQWRQMLQQHGGDDATLRPPWVASFMDR